MRWVLLIQIVKRIAISGARRGLKSSSETRGLAKEPVGQLRPGDLWTKAPSCNKSTLFLSTVHPKHSQAQVFHETP